jgi:hypothetical protein
MADPFPPQETSLGVTLDVLRTLSARQYPTVISTKGIQFVEPRYLEVLAAGNFLVQVSLSTLDDDLACVVERGAPSPSARLGALAKATEHGLKVAVRHQPVLPGREHEIRAVIDAGAEAGCSHYAVEFLKLGIEGRGLRPLQRELGDVLSTQTRRREGREWVLDLGERLHWVMDARETAHASGLTFGAADNDLLPLSDGNVCCSGADFHLRDVGHQFTHQYLAAVRFARGGQVTRDLIAAEWVPKRTIARFVNSTSRISGHSGAGMSDYIDRNWNGRANGPSPSMFAGVSPNGDLDADGFETYDVAPWLLKALKDRTLIQSV